MPQPVACSELITASLRPGTHVEVPEQLSQMLQGEGVYRQPYVQEQRLSCCLDGGEKAPRAVIIAGGCPGCVADREKHVFEQAQSHKLSAQEPALSKGKQPACC